MDFTQHQSCTDHCPLNIKRMFLGIKPVDFPCLYKDCLIYHAVEELLNVEGIKSDVSLYANKNPADCKKTCYRFTAKAKREHTTDVISGWDICSKETAHFDSPFRLKGVELIDQVEITKVENEDFVRGCGTADTCTCKSKKIKKFYHDMPLEFYIAEFRQSAYNRLTSALRKSIPSYSFMSPKELEEFIMARRRSSELTTKNTEYPDDYKDSTVIEYCYQGYVNDGSLTNSNVPSTLCRKDTLAPSLLSNSILKYFPHPTQNNIPTQSWAPTKRSVLVQVAKRYAGKNKPYLLSSYNVRSYYTNALKSFKTAAMEC